MEKFHSVILFIDYRSDHHGINGPLQLILTNGGLSHMVFPPDAKESPDKDYAQQEIIRHFFKHLAEKPDKSFHFSNAHEPQCNGCADCPHLYETSCTHVESLAITHGGEIRSVEHGEAYGFITRICLTKSSAFRTQED